MTFTLVPYLSVWAPSNSRHQFSYLLLLVILSITVRCLGRLYSIVWSACSLINIGANGQTWGQAVEETRMPSTPFLCLDKCERGLSGADVGSYLLPPKLLSSTGGFRTVRQTGKPEVRAPAAPVPRGVAVTYTRPLHSVGSSSLSSSRTGPWAWFTPQSVCIRDNWEAIWLSFRCRGMNVVFWGILQLFVSCLLSPDKWSHFSSAWSLLERTRIQALKFALTVWKHMSCWPWIGHLEDSSRFKTC